MKQTISLLGSAITLCLNLTVFASDTFIPYSTVAEVPQNPTDLWKDYDHRIEALEVEVLKQWQEDGVVTRYITF